MSDHNRPTPPVRSQPADAPRALVIFDCDGVLVASERLSHQVLQEMLAELGVMLSFDDTVRRFIGTSQPTCMARVADLLGAAPPADFQARFAQRTQLAFEAQLQVVPGIEALLAALRTPYCVASNGNRAKVDFTLRHTGLLARFAGRIFTADDVTHPKPAPDLFLLAARTLGVDPARTTVVEDTPTGIAAAKAAGMRAIGYAAMTPVAQLQAAGADAVLVTMAEVAQRLEVPG